MNPFDRIQCEDLPPVEDDEFDDLDVVLDDDDDGEEEDEEDEN